MGTCNCPCCKDSKAGNDDEQESNEEERKYAENELEAIEQTESLKRNKSKSKRRKKHKLQIDYFDKLATEIIRYGIAPCLFVWERIGLSRINKAFYKMFTIKQKTNSYFNVTKFFKPYREKEQFLDENCKSVGSCKFNKLSYGERKLLLFFILCQEYNNFDTIYSVNLWSLSNSKHNNYNEFISNLLYCLSSINYLQKLTFSDLFNSNKNFTKYFIESFSYNKFIDRKRYKFCNLIILNLDFNKGLNDSNCNLLFTKCIIPNMCPKLEELHLTHTNIGDASCKTIYDFFYKYMSKGVTLHELILNDNYKITSRGVDNINKVLSSYKTPDSTKYPIPTVSLKNNLNKRNWRLYKSYWHKNIVTGYKPPPPKPSYQSTKSRNRASAAGGRAF